jgi:hypothetical protein
MSSNGTALSCISDRLHQCAKHGYTGVGACPECSRSAKYYEHIIREIMGEIRSFPLMSKDKVDKRVRMLVRKYDNF